MVLPIASPQLRIEQLGACGLVGLDRPSALNALSGGMVTGLNRLLDQWRHSGPDWILLEGLGGKAFSAGADVRAVWENANSGDATATHNYFAEEYALDLAIAQYPKPIISIVDGICFGGGMALAVHSRYCVTTEAAAFAMPETLIGFFPDAGASHFLSRLRASIGTWLGMTGHRISGGDAAALGLASHLVARENLSSLREQLIASGPDALVNVMAEPPALSFEAHLDEIAECFGADSVEDIFARLDTRATAWSRATLETLKSRSPASLRWTLQSQRQGAQLSLEAALAGELRLVAISTAHPDFREGVRAALVDKDKNPRWQA